MARSRSPSWLAEPGAAEKASRLQARGGGEVHGLEGEVEVPDGGVVHVLRPGAMSTDVVGGPEGAEQIVRVASSPTRSVRIRS